MCVECMLVIYCSSTAYFLHRVQFWFVNNLHNVFLLASRRHTLCGYLSTFDNKTILHIYRCLLVKWISSEYSILWMIFTKRWHCSVSCLFNKPRICKFYHNTCNRGIIWMLLETVVCKIISNCDIMFHPPGVICYRVILLSPHWPQLNASVTSLMSLLSSPPRMTTQRHMFHFIIWTSFYVKDNSTVYLRSCQSMKSQCQWNDCNVNFNMNK